MFDRTQWFLAGISIALSIQLSQPAAAAVPVGKVVQIAQTNSSSVSSVTKKLYEEAEKLYKQRTPEGFRGAIANWEEALKLFRAEGNGRGEGILYFIGLAYSQLGEKEKALDYYSQSLSLARGEGSSIDEATSLTSIGLVYSQLGEKQKALEYYSQSLPLRRTEDNRGGEAVTLSSMAFVKRELGNLMEALTDIEASIKIIENLRTKIAAPELCSSYFATVQEYYEFYIDLLMQLHKANPNSGYAIKASEAKKRAINP